MPLELNESRVECSLNLEWSCLDNIGIPISAQELCDSTQYISHRNYDANNGRRRFPGNHISNHYLLARLPSTWPLDTLFRALQFDGVPFPAPTPSGASMPRRGNNSEYRLANSRDVDSAVECKKFGHPKL